VEEHAGGGGGTEGEVGGRGEGGREVHQHAAVPRGGGGRGGGGREAHGAGDGHRGTPVPTGWLEAAEHSVAALRKLQVAGAGGHVLQAPMARENQEMSRCKLKHC